LVPDFLLPDPSFLYACFLCDWSPKVSAAQAWSTESIVFPVLGQSFVKQKGGRILQGCKTESSPDLILASGNPMVPDHLRIGKEHRFLDSDLQRGKFDTEEPQRKSALVGPPQQIVCRLPQKAFIVRCFG
jgi:hypothetical protein